MTEPEPAAWTIDQLSQLVAEALAAHGLGQSNGRVRQVPDVRTIRWYTSIGLLDRPAAMRGRTALYGRRHLAQIVAVKRLQAEGLALADVQQQLIGADDAALERVARLGEPSGATEPSQPSEVTTSPDPASRGRFWSARPLQATAPQPTTTGRDAAVSSALIHAIRLAPDVALLLDAAAAAPDDESLAVIARAAQPLLDALRALGLSHEQRSTGQQPSEGGHSR